MIIGSILKLEFLQSHYLKRIVVGYNQLMVYLKLNLN